MGGGGGGGWVGEEENRLCPRAFRMSCFWLAKLLLL